MRLGKTALYHFFSQIVISITGFAATFAIVNLLGTDGLGLYSVAVGLGFYWLAIPANGVSKAIKKRMSEGTEADQYYGAGVVLNGAVAVTMGTLVLAAGWTLDQLALPDAVFVQVLVTYDVEVATLVVGATALRTTLAGLEGGKQVARSGGMMALERVGRSTVQILLVVGGFGVTAITVGHAATLLFVSAVALAVAAVRPSRPRRRHVQSLASFARYSWMGALRGRVYGWMDTIVLSLFLGSAALIGIYEVAWGIGSLLGTASTSISRTLFPEMSELSTDGDYDRVRHYLDEALAYAGVIVIPGLVGAVVIGGRVLRFVRPDIGQGATVLAILVFAYVADVYASQLLNVVNGIDRPDVAFRINGAFIAVNAVLNVVLVLEFGWEGAAVATAVSALLRVGLGYVVLRKLIDIVSVPGRTLAAEVGAAAGMGLVVVLVRPEVPAGRVGTLGLVGLGAAIYFGGLLAFSARFRDKGRMLAAALR